MAAPVHQVWPPVPNRAEAGENRNLVNYWFQGFQLRHDFIVAASLAWDPASAARRCVCQAQPPEVSAKPDRQPRSIGERCAIAIEETVKEWKTDADSRAIQHAAQKQTAIDRYAHRKPPLVSLGAAVAAAGVEDARWAPLGTTTLKNSGLEAICAIKSGSRYPLRANALVWSEINASSRSSVLRPTP